MNPLLTHSEAVTRRYFLGQCTGVSLGAMALEGLLQSAAASEPERNAVGGLTGLPHFAAKAKRVIFLTQSGGPSQIELFDEKPDLAKWAGKELPDSVRQGQRLTAMTANQKQLILPSRTQFLRHGQSGASVGEWLPHLGKVADDICIIKSMHTEQINHAPAATPPTAFLRGVWQSAGCASSSSFIPTGITTAGSPPGALPGAATPINPARP